MTSVRGDRSATSSTRLALRRACGEGEGAGWPGAPGGRTRHNPVNLGGGRAGSLTLLPWSPWEGRTSRKPADREPQGGSRTLSVVRGLPHHRGPPVTTPLQVVRCRVPRFLAGDPSTQLPAFPGLGQGSREQGRGCPTPASRERMVTELGQRSRDRMLQVMFSKKI